MEDEKPPFLHSWRNVYLLVVAVLVVIIIGLNFFTNYFE